MIKCKLGIQVTTAMIRKHNLCGQNMTIFKGFAL